MDWPTRPNLDGFCQRLLINIGLFDFQHSSYLPARRRSDFALASLVCPRTGPQSDGRHDIGPDRRRSIHRLSPFQRVIWYGALALYMLMNCWGGFKHAQSLLRMAKLPRRHGYSCPTCKTSPPVGAYWKCGHCGQPFDTFETGAICPNCQFQFPATQCLDCGRQHPLSEWMGQTVLASDIQFAQPR